MKNQKLNLRKLNQWSLNLVFILMGLGASACGGTPYQQIADGNGQGSPIQPTGGVTSSPNSPQPDFNPAYSFDFSITGPQGSTPTATTNVPADSILVVKVNAGAAGNLSVPGYENYTAPYGCIQYTIEVNGHSETTDVLAVPGGISQYLCPGAPSEQIIDFSPYAGGAGQAEVKVRNARYDFRCLWVNSMECPMSNVYYSHTVTGSLDIQVNGTYIP